MNDLERIELAARRCADALVGQDEAACRKIAEAFREFSDEIAKLEREKRNRD